MTRLPKSIRLQGKDYEVVEAPPGEIEGNYGICQPHLCRISLAKDPSVNPQQARDTLLHEVLHALTSECALRGTAISDGESEEHIVRVLATALLAVLRDNPKLVDYLLDD